MEISESQAFLSALPAMAVLVLCGQWLLFATLRWYASGEGDE
jgi:hypothetical protein